MSEQPLARKFQDGDDHSVPRSGWLTKLFNPWILLTLLIVVAILSAPFVYWQMRLAGLPEIEELFDVEAFVNQEVKPGNNALSDYRHATSLFVRPTTEIENELIKLNEIDRDYLLPELLTWLDSSICKLRYHPRLQISHT